MPSNFSRELVEQVARLARLRLTPAELERFPDQLARILGYAQQVQEVDTTGVDPTFHVVGAAQPLREDEVRPGLTTDDALKNAPGGDRSAGLFKVPRVLG